MMRIIINWCKLLRELVFDPNHCRKLVLALLAIDALLTVAIINLVPYVEVDWMAYMQEVEGVMWPNGTYNYSLLKGDTGPLVYPAGFVWIYWVLHEATDSGNNIRRAQYIFCILYIMMLTLVFRIHMRNQKLPPSCLILLSLWAYRVRFIFVLHLFNDPIAMLLFYIAINLFMDGWWSLGSICYSLAVSVKMNILLFAPALFLAYLAILGPAKTLAQLTICAGTQLLLAWPFILHDPISYLKGSFDLGRVFLYKETVNWCFLPEDLFLDNRFQVFLLLCHVLVLAACVPGWWRMLQKYSVLWKAKTCPESSVQLLLVPLFMCNLVGMAFARSLHSQFYVWYFHQLAFLLWCCKEFSDKQRVLILTLVEYAWSPLFLTVVSSAILHCCHFLVLGALFRMIYDGTIVATKKQ